MEDEIKQENEKFLSKIKDKRNSLILKVRECWDKAFIGNRRLYAKFFFEDIKSKRFQSCILEYLEVVDFNPLYFDFGRYEGYIVQDIVKKDPDYCRWFVKNVRGDHESTLEIIDYLVKKLNNKYYWSISAECGLHQLLSIILTPKEYDKWYTSSIYPEIVARLTHYVISKDQEDLISEANYEHLDFKTERWCKL